jgi:hypothetical protein
MPIYLFNKTFLPLMNAYVCMRSPFYCGHAIIGIRQQGGREFQSISAPTPRFLHSCLLVPLVVSNNMPFTTWPCLSDNLRLQI